MEQIVFILDKEDISSNSDQEKGRGWVEWFILNPHHFENFDLIGWKKLLRFASILGVRRVCENKNGYLPYVGNSLLYKNRINYYDEKGQEKLTDNLFTTVSRPLGGVSTLEFWNHKLEGES